MTLSPKILFPFSPASSIFQLELISISEGFIELFRFDFCSVKCPGGVDRSPNAFNAVARLPRLVTKV